MNINDIEKKIIRDFKRNSIITFLILIVMLFFKYVIYKEVILWVINFIFFAVFFCCIGSLVMMHNIKGLKNDEELSSELNNILFHILYNYMLTENYVIGHYSKKEAVNYKDIVLICYSYSGTRNGIYKKLDIINKYGKKYSFEIGSTSLYLGKEEEPKNFSNILLEKNQNILVGKTKENKKILLEKYNIKI